MKLLITGASGFIGSYFMANYKDTYDLQKFSFLHDDVDVLDVASVDAVLHLSALVHKMGGASDAEYERVNITQMLVLAKKAKEGGVRRFVFMSSVKVYGEESDGVYKEDSPCVPQDTYARSKLEAENLLRELADESFEVFIIRTPIVYGYGVKANIKSLQNLVKYVPILPFANIKNRRSLVSVGNLCHLVDVVLRLPLGAVCEATLPSLNKSYESIFLAADDTPISTTKLIELMAKSMDKKIILFKIPLFETLLKFLKPSFHKRLYGSLEVDNTQTKEKLNLKNPFVGFDLTFVPSKM